MQSLTGSVSIITGAGRGIGKAIALLLGLSGSRVVLAARNESQLRDVGEEIRGSGGEALEIPTDLTKDDEVRRLAEETLKNWGTVDYLINNAGWGRKGPLLKSRLEEWDRTFDVNVRAPMLLTQFVLPTLIAKKQGAIINIASISGKIGQANSAAYCASKFALLGFSESLFEEVREYGIKVAAILPGFVDTPLIPPTRALNREKMISPEEIAQAVLFVLTSGPSCCPVEITIRPQRSPYV